MWREFGLASPGVQSVCETGSASTLVGTSQCFSSWQLYTCHWVMRKQSVSRDDVVEVSIQYLLLCTVSLYLPACIPYTEKTTTDRLGQRKER